MRVKHIIKETKKRLKRKSKRLDPAVIKKIEEDIAQLESARAGKNRKKLNDAKKRIFSARDVVMSKRSFILLSLAVCVIAKNFYCYS